MVDNQTEKLLDERAATHGEYFENARISQGIMVQIMSGRNWKNLTAIQRESLHMFAHKIGRICEGDPNHKDHWDDISGYAILVSQRLTPHEDVTRTYIEPENSDFYSKHAKVLGLTRTEVKDKIHESLYGNKEDVPRRHHVDGVPVHAIGDLPHTEASARIIVDTQYSKDHPARKGGSMDMKLGDKIRYAPGSRRVKPRFGIAGEFKQDGTVEVFFLDTWTWTTVSWNWCSLADPAPVPIEDSNRHAERALRSGINTNEFLNLATEVWPLYIWDEGRQEWQLRTDE